jgi:DNA-binding response OmpR family regulator
MKILVIEDEPRMLELLRRGLQDSDYTVSVAQDGLAGLEIATSYEQDAIVLDIGLPHRDGYELVRMLRERRKATPVLMLTARDSEDEIIRGLDLGADDYMTKPFSFPELVLRLQSITRSVRGRESSKLQIGDLAIDPVRRTVTRGHKPLDLSKSEFSLLLALARNAGTCVPRHILIERVWGPNPVVGNGALDVLVNATRSRVDVPFEPKLIATVRGEGYMLSGPATMTGAQR